MMSKGFGTVSEPKINPTLKKFKRSVLEKFDALDDPRVKRQPRHLLIDIVTIAILAILCGADNIVAIETYGKRKQKWLESFLELPHGIPSHDTFSRVLSMLNPQQLHECFLAWVNHLSETLDIKHISI